MPDRSRFSPWLRASAVLVFGLALTGCVTGGGWAAGLALAMSLGALALSGCSGSHEAGADASIVSDAGGSWNPCCSDGRITTCFCPANSSCNYFYDDCGDGTCGSYPDTCPVAPDAAVVADAGTDAGGSWNPCCLDGRIDTCFCPGGAACNYFYTDCGDGTCADPSSTCSDGGAASDAGVAPDAGAP